MKQTTQAQNKKRFYICRLCRSCKDSVDNERSDKRWWIAVEAIAGIILAGVIGSLYTTWYANTQELQT